MSAYIIFQLNAACPGTSRLTSMHMHSIHMRNLALQSRILPSVVIGCGRPQCLRDNFEQHKMRVLAFFTSCTINAHNTAHACICHALPTDVNCAGLYSSASLSIDIAIDIAMAVMGIIWQYEQFVIFTAQWSLAHY